MTKRDHCFAVSYVPYHRCAPCKCCVGKYHSKYPCTAVNSTAALDFPPAAAAASRMYKDAYPCTAGARHSMFCGDYDSDYDRVRPQDTKFFSVLLHKYTNTWYYSTVIILSYIKQHTHSTFHVYTSMMWSCTHHRNPSRASLRTNEQQRPTPKLKSTQNSTLSCIMHSLLLLIVLFLL